MSRITDTLPKDLYTFMITHSILRRMRNVSDKSYRENQNTYFIFNHFFFFRKSCHLRDSAKKYGVAGHASDDSKIERMRIACWITKTADTHSECVVLIDFTLEQ